MKYMGSKTTLLAGELGEIILEQCESSGRFVDLFAGSGAVAHYVALNTVLPVTSVDLQEYSRVLTASVTERTVNLAKDLTLNAWLDDDPDDNAEVENAPLTKQGVLNQRIISAASAERFITRHYGGHYFSLHQAREFDSLYRALPSAEPAKTVALAALLRAASICAAAPGHTAQPFQPTEKLLPYIAQAWSRDVRATVKSTLATLAPKHAQTAGKAIAGDAGEIAATLSETDLVFCDPPYSAVQYSRFYHVLEGIALGGWDEVSGKGRAPALTSRKASDFSMKSKAPKAMKDLLRTLHERKCRAIITFPDTDASNGLSGDDIITLAREDWNVDTRFVDSVHSTLGGSSEGTRGGRKALKEAVILLEPKRASVPISRPIALRPIEELVGRVAVNA